MRRYILAVTLFGVTFLHAEISAFDAGNLQNSSPYGLTPNEKALKEKLDVLDNGYSQANSQMNILSEKIDGLQSIIEGINLQYTKADVRISRLEDANLSNTDANLSQEIQNLKIYVEESRRIQEANNQQFKKVLMELSLLVDSINNNYLAKKVDLNKTIQHPNSTVNIADKNEIKLASDTNLSAPIDQNTTQIMDLNSSTKTQNLDINQTEKVTHSVQNTDDLDSSWRQKTPREIMKIAIDEVSEGKFASAKEKFELLLLYKHKPSESNFYLGEIEYQQGNYQGAIAFYKKSSMIASKTKFTPKLLYHTAISLDKVGDTQNANGFYKALKTNYPNSPEAKASPDRK